MQTNALEKYAFIYFLSVFKVGNHSFSHCNVVQVLCLCMKWHNMIPNPEHCLYSQTRCQTEFRKLNVLRSQLMLRSYFITSWCMVSSLWSIYMAYPSIKYIESLTIVWNHLCNVRARRIPLQNVNNAIILVQKWITSQLDIHHLSLYVECHLVW